MATSEGWRPCWKRPRDLTGMDMESKLMEVRRKLEVEEKAKLELAHGVHIHEDALNLVCNIVGRCFDAIWSNDAGESGNSLEVVLLAEKAVELLEEACVRARQNVDTNAEENQMDKAEYLLYRSLVELKEVKKEKYHASRVWIPRVQTEYQGLIDMWGRLIGKWKPLVMLQSRSERRAQQIYTLEEMRLGLLSALKEVEATRKTDLISDVVEKFGALMTELLQKTNENFKKHITVCPRIVAEVASPMTHFPASWLRNSWKPPLQGLRKRLTKNLIVQRNAIIAITNALSRPRPVGSGTRPIGSFLFLCDFYFGGAELVEALAEQLYDSKDQFTRFDMSDYRDLHSVCCDPCSLGVRPRGYNHEEHGVGGKLIQAVKNRPCSVLLFDNFDKAHNYAVEILLEIMQHGQLIDCGGNTVDFSKTLIVIISDVGKNMYEPLRCKCLEKDRDLPIKLQMYLPPWERKHECSFLGVLRAASRCLKTEMYEQVDDIVILDVPTIPQFSAIARFQLRAVPDTLKQKRLILCPSEAALRCITLKSCCKVDTGKRVRTWLEGNVVPVLFKILAENEINDMSVIYLDVLVGTEELSYRLKTEGPVDDKDFRQLKEVIKELRTIYQKEKERVKMICSLRRESFKLKIMLHEKAMEDFSFVDEVLQQFVSSLEFLVKSAIDVSFRCKEYKLVPLKSLNEAELRQEETLNANASKGVEGLRTRLSRSSGRYHQAIEVLAEAMLTSIDQPQNQPRLPARCFLFLGLTTVGKADLAKGLSELFATDDGTQLVARMNLQEFSKSNSFFQLLYEIFGLSLPLNDEQHGSWLPEVVKMRPRILLVDEIEMVHISVFSALISVLDHGLSNNQGRMVDLSNTIVVIMSHLGNKEMLASLVGVTPGASVQERDYEERGRRFRTELLNRVDELVLVNPLAAEQLSKVARLPMRSGRHLEDGPYHALPWAFFYLFLKSNDPFFWQSSVGPLFAIALLSKGLICDRRNGMVGS